MDNCVYELNENTEVKGLFDFKFFPLKSFIKDSCSCLELHIKLIMYFCLDVIDE